MKKKDCVLLFLIAVVFCAEAVTVYQNEFNGAAEGAGTVEPIIRPAGFTAAENGIALNGSGYLIAKKISSDTGYRFSLGTAPLTAEIGATVIKYTAVLRTPVHEWIGLGYTGENSPTFLRSEADSGPWILFNSNGSITLRAGTWNVGNFVTVDQVYTPGDIITAEMIFHTDTQTADVIINGKSAIHGFALHHEFPVGTPARPSIAYVLIQLRNQPPDGACIDSLKVEVISSSDAASQLLPPPGNSASVHGDLAPENIVVTASSELPFEPAVLAVDGDPGTCWLPSIGGMSWLQLEFSKPLRIESMDVLWAPSASTPYRFETSADGKVWSTLCSGQIPGRIPSMKKNAVQLSSPVGAVRYLRLWTRGGFSELWLNGRSLSGAVAGLPPPIPKDAPYRNPALDPEQRAANVLSLMTDSEKHLFVSGYHMFYIRPLTRFGLREVYLMDATAGVHLRGGLDGDPEGVRESIAYPCAVALAATWNTGLAGLYGRSVARECRELGADILLGPGFNLYRTSTCGRNFEYMGEDPILAADMIVPYIHEMQSEKVVATAKHFICNNQEWMRLTADSVVDDRALHEVYMYPWYCAVHRGQVAAVMSSYNWLNGEKVSQSSMALNGLLRHDIGFKGLVMSDWGAVTDSAAALVSGLDLIMPRVPQVAAFQCATRTETVRNLDRMVRNILIPLFRFGIYDRERHDPEYLGKTGRKECESVALQTARESITLLKNNGILPLSATDTASVLVLGPDADQTRYAGGGSGGVKGYGHTNIGPEMRRLLGDTRVVSKDWKTVDDETLRTAATIVLCVDHEDRECWDHLPQLPDDQQQLVQRCLRLNHRTVVVVNSGSGLIMDWADSAAALLWAYYPGQYGGTAIAEILTGAVNPSGKLPYTIERQFADSPAVNYKPDGAGWHDRIDPKDETQFERMLPEHPQIVYQEGVFSGYRWYDSRKLAVRYPFGFGLSYTEFKYSDLYVQVDASGITVKAQIANVGTVAGKETVQLYLGGGNSSVLRPLRELKAFSKIELAPGESRSVEFHLNPVDLAYYDERTKNWRVEPGQYSLSVAASSRDIRLSKAIQWKQELFYRYPTDVNPVVQ